MMRRSTIAVTGVILSLMLGGCGGSEDSASPDSTDESSESAGESPSESQSPEPSAEPGFDVSTAKLPQDPFCDSIDKALVADVLGLKAAQVKLLIERRLGEKYTLYPGAPELTSKANACNFGTPDTPSAPGAQMMVTATPGETAAEVKKTLEFYRSMDDPKASSSDVCSVADESSVGDPGALITCEGILEGNKGQVSVYLVGLLDGGSFGCQAAIGQGSTPDKLEEPVHQACLTILESLTAS